MWFLLALLQLLYLNRHCFLSWNWCWRKEAECVVSFLSLATHRFQRSIYAFTSRRCILPCKVTVHDGGEVTPRPRNNGDVDGFMKLSDRKAMSCLFERTRVSLASVLRCAQWPELWRPTAHRAGIERIGIERQRASLSSMHRRLCGGSFNLVWAGYLDSR